MPPPSQLSIATSVVTRLIKEEASYHKEAEQQKARIAKLEANNGDEYELRQEKTALDETYKVFPSLHAKIKDAVAKLETQLKQDSGSGASPEEIIKAQSTINEAHAALSKIAQ